VNQLQPTYKIHLHHRCN